MTSPTKTQIQYFPNFLKSNYKSFRILGEFEQLNLLASYGRVCWRHFAPNLRRTPDLKDCLNKKKVDKPCVFILIHIAMPSVTKTMLRHCNLNASMIFWRF